MFNGLPLKLVTEIQDHGWGFREAQPGWVTGNPQTLRRKQGSKWGQQKNLCMSAQSLQLCLTLCDPLHCSLPGSSVHGTLQQEYWRRLPCPPPGDLPDPGIKPMYLKSLALAGGFFTTSITWEAPGESSTSSTTQMRENRRKRKFNFMPKRMRGEKLQNPQSYNFLPP